MLAPSQSALERSHTTLLACQDPNLSVVLRTRNNERYIASTLMDIATQDFEGEVQVIVVDTESTDRTVHIARALGAQVITMTQADFSYPESLNRGFVEAEHPYVITLTNRTNLTNNQALRVATRWQHNPDFGGAFGAMIWNDETSAWETSLATTVNMREERLQPASQLNNWCGGAMVAHRSLVSLEAWRALGGYDPNYKRGGEDTDFARRLIKIGAAVIRDPALSVHHSHGHMSLTETWHYAREMKHLRHGPPDDFDPEHLARFRADLEPHAA